MSPLRLVPVFVLAVIATPVLAGAQQSASRAQAESAWRPSSTLDSFFGRRTLKPTLVDTTASRVTSICPMPVARADTTRLERMPRAHLDSLRMAPMPVAHGCVADGK
jgi:hypothetical protein